MSRSAKGTKAQPGKKVGPKSGLNRSILDASPFELRRQLEYKTEWNGGLLVVVSPHSLFAIFAGRKCVLSETHRGHRMRERIGPAGIPSLHGGEDVNASSDGHARRPESSTSTKGRP